MRLLLVVNDASTFFTHRLPWARAAQGAGYEVHVGGPIQQAASEIAALGFHARPFPFVRGVGAPRKVAEGLQKGLDVVRSVRPTIVHVVGTQLVATFAPLLRRSIAPALVLSVTGLGHAFLSEGARGRAMRWITAGGYAFCRTHGNARFVFQNRDDLATMRSFLPLRGLPATLIRGSGVDTAQFPFSPIPVSEPPLIVFPARLIREKGIVELLAALRLLKSSKTPFRCRLVGSVDPSNPSSTSEAEVHEWVHQGLVEWSGPSRDMPAVFREGAIVALPSFREGLPKALLEAASVGRPIVATDVPGCREVVQDGVTGTLVPLGDTRALASALDALLRSPELRASMGAAGRRRVETSLSVEQVTAAYLDVYRSLTDRLR
ncbi:MAG: glycosyltransferase family 4 protein [Myxococcota bacterium]